MENNGYIGWAEVAPETQGSTDKPTYLWLKSGNKYKVRPIHYAVPVCKYFHRGEDNKLRYAVWGDETNGPSRKSFSLSLHERSELGGGGI